MTKFVLCIIVGVVSLAAYNTMVAVGENEHDQILIDLPVKLFNGDPKLNKCLDFNTPFFKGPKPDRDIFPAEVVPCSKDRVNQIWTVTPEGFIRSWDKKFCLTYEPFLKIENSVNARDCDGASAEAKKWKVWKDGSITHYAHQALTAAYPFVILDKNTHVPSQVWEMIPYRSY